MAVDNDAIKELLLSNRKAAKSEMDAILTADRLEHDFFAGHLYSYVLYKFMLDPSKTTEKGFNALTDLSMSQSMKISPELVKQFDLAQSCDGTSSAMAKKVLLFRNIEKTLDIQLPAMATARIKTLSDLCELTWDTLCQSHVWQSKIMGA